MKVERGRKAARPALMPRDFLSAMKVRDVMNRKARTIAPDVPIADLIERIRQQIEGCFPVVDKNRKLVGIVTESDILHILQVPARQATVGGLLVRDIMKRMARTVEEIMTRRVITVTPDTTLQETINLMATHKLRHLPVVKDDKLVGLICLRDIMELYHLIK